MKNRSGIRPLDYRVLIQPDTTKKKTAGGIIIPDETHEREGWSQVKGTVVAVGDGAFKEWTTVEKAALRPGARIYYDKYQGILVTGADDEEYRLLNDNDIGAIILEEGAGQSTILGGRKKGGLAAA